MVKPFDKEIHDQYARILGKCVASMSVFYKRLRLDGGEFGAVEYSNYSGFVMSFGDEWCFVTAGHAIRDLDIEIDQKLRKMGICQIHATLPVQEDVPDVLLPFDYESSIRFFEAPGDATIDCGAILLTHEQRAELQRQGITPFKSELTNKYEASSFEQFISIGIPAQSWKPRTVDLRSGDEGHEGRSTLQFMPMVLASQTIKEPHCDRLYAKSKESQTLDEMNGMSGSPIFGFRVEKDGGGTHFGLLAIQTNYVEAESTICGCHSKTFVPLIREWLKGLEEAKIGSQRRAAMKKKRPISQPKKKFFNESVDSYRTEYESWKRTKIVPSLVGIFEIPGEVLGVASVSQLVSQCGLEGYSVLSYTDGNDYAPRSIVPMGITVSVKKPYGKVQPVIFLQKDMVPDDKDAPEEMIWALRLLMLMHELGHAEDISLGINLKHERNQGDIVAAEAYAHAFVCKHAKRMCYWRALRSYIIDLETSAASPDDVWRLGAQRALAELDIKGLRAECAVHVG